ncbi:alpha/beta fold hydrolase [Pigmentiphaga soli]|uniref:Alpha/beta fold hydrolase n=1 Tax=Pigmentiphaga soli TaxID=1007095 RepID=A0ABP8GW91_9BURK
MTQQIFNVPRLSLQCGTSVANVRLSFECHGSLCAAKDNVVLVFTPFGTTSSQCGYLFGNGRPIDPAKHFIVVFDTFGNGASFSPSNAPAPYGRDQFPEVTILDNVVAQHIFVTEVLGVREIQLAVGHSMGALQAYQWAASFPGMVRRLAPICGAARVSEHNALFLDGIRRVITEDPDWNHGRYTAPPARALRRAARVWAPWAPSPGFYQGRGYLQLGFESLEAFLVGLWERNFERRDANDILAQIWAWQHADISRNGIYEGDFEKALGSIEARAVILPGISDCYFPVADSAYEASHLRRATLLPIPSPWGHWAGNGRRPEDLRFVDDALRQLWLMP